jgi:beta-galactosidase
MVKVYSNCDEVELFVNGKTCGVKKRNSQDFPAAGLRWSVILNDGHNEFLAIGKKGNAVVEDRLSQQYQTTSWSSPSKLIVEEIDKDNDIVTVRATLVDANNVPCLDAANWIHFSSTGDGILLDNLGTSSGSRKVQAYNGRVTIRLKTNGGKNVVCVQSPSLPTVFLTMDKKTATP